MIPEGRKRFFSVYMTSESRLEQCLYGLEKGFKTNSLTWETRPEEDRILLILKGGREGERGEYLKRLEAELGGCLIRNGNIGPAESLFRLLKRRRHSLCAAESCTGGLVSKMITDLPGSSSVYLGGCVAYSNRIKQKVLGVAEKLIAEMGAVSKNIVEAMAGGAIKLFDSDFALAVSGIAGPSGGTIEKPVGTVWIGVADKTGVARSRIFRFDGVRADVRKKASITALVMMERFILGEDQLDIVSNW